MAAPQKRVNIRKTIDILERAARLCNPEDPRVPLAARGFGAVVLDFTSNTTQHQELVEAAEELKKLRAEEMFTD